MSFPRYLAIATATTGESVLVLCGSTYSSVMTLYTNIWG